MVGLFGVAEVFTQMYVKVPHVQDIAVKLTGILPSWADVKRLMPHAISGTLIGIWIGIMPAAGADVGAIMAWGQSRRMSRKPEEFGHGSPEGLVAAFTGANAGIGGSLVTTLALGIPGDSTGAVLIGALLIHGLQPGPLLFRNRPEIVAQVIALVFMSAIITLIWGLVGAKPLARILKVKDELLWGLVLMICCVGSYALNQSTVDVWTAIVAGAFGFVLRRLEFPMGPLVLALILGPMAESNLRRALTLSQGDVSILFTRPISLLFLVLTAASFLWPLLTWLRGDKRRTTRPRRRKRSRSSRWSEAGESRRYGELAMLASCRSTRSRDVRPTTLTERAPSRRRRRAGARREARPGGAPHVRGGRRTSATAADPSAGRALRGRCAGPRARAGR